MAILRCCPAPGCGRIIPATSTACPDHDRQARNRATGRNRAEWQRTRKRILTRDGGQCTLVKGTRPRCPNPANQVHRIAGGYHADDDRYASVCASCHATLSQFERTGSTLHPLTFATGPPTPTSTHTPTTTGTTTRGGGHRTQRASSPQNVPIFPRGKLGDDQSSVGYIR